MNIAINIYNTLTESILTDTIFNPDAKWGIAKLRELGHKIIIITDKTDAFYTDPFKTTKEKLKNSNIIYDKLICTFDKANFCIAENISVLIDTLPDNCISAVNNEIPALLFTNKGIEYEKTEFLYVKNWTEAVEAVKQIERGYPNKENAEKLLANTEAINPGPWGDHCRVAAKCAEKIAIACSMDAEKAYVLSLLHDIGRISLVINLGHVYYGYVYMQRLGYRQVAKVCISHAFPNQKFELYIGKIDIPEDEANEVKKLLLEMEFDDYDRLTQLCDTLAGSKGVWKTIEKRMANVKRRYGNYPRAQWNKNIELKHYFEEKTGRNIYDIVN